MLSNVEQCGETGEREGEAQNTTNLDFVDVILDTFLLRIVSSGFFT